MRVVSDVSEECQQGKMCCFVGRFWPCPAEPGWVITIKTVFSSRPSPTRRWNTRPPSPPTSARRVSCPSRSTRCASWRWTSWAPSSTRPSLPCVTLRGNLWYTPRSVSWSRWKAIITRIRWRERSSGSSRWPRFVANYSSRKNDQRKWAKKSFNFLTDCSIVRLIDWVVLYWIYSIKTWSVDFSSYDFSLEIWETHKFLLNSLLLKQTICRLIDRSILEFSGYDSIDWLMDWLIDWWVVRLIDWLIDQWIDWLIDWLTDWLIDWLIRLLILLLHLRNFWRRPSQVSKKWPKLSRPKSFGAIWTTWTMALRRPDRGNGPRVFVWCTRWPGRRCGWRICRKTKRRSVCVSSSFSCVPMTITWWWSGPPWICSWIRGNWATGADCGPTGLWTNSVAWNCCMWRRSTKYPTPSRRSRAARRSPWDDLFGFTIWARRNCFGNANPR